MKVVITENAWSDMLAIAGAIRENSPSRAQTFIEELYERCLGVGRLPKAYPLVPGRESSGIRRRLHGSYLIFYRIAESRVEVLHVVHGAREYERILFPND